MLTHPPPPTPSKGSDWCRVIDTGLTTSDGRTVREVLIDVMQSFESYDLKTDEGIHNAIKEMETQIGEVASMEEHDVLVEYTPE
jgi:hypothetical protein